MILWAGTLTTMLLIGAASLGGDIHFANAAAGQILKIVTSDGGSTFYVGRCFRTDFRAQTDTLDANSIDVIIPYNPTYLAPYTGSGCTVAATSVTTHSAFPSYPSNTISGNQVILTGYDPSGTNSLDTGAAPADRTFGHLFWKVLAASGSYHMNYTFTLGSTIDTNMAENGGDGSDVLDAVENLTLNLADDSTDPTFTSLSPANAASNVSVTTGITYTFNDAGAGVNSGSLTTRLAGTSKPLTFSGCVRTNGNRIASCNVTVGSVGTLSYNTLYTVSATGSDAASPTPNEASTMWQFTTEDDDDAPYVDGRNPASGATGVAVNSNIVFHVKDYKNNAGVTPGLGVDISTVTVAVTPAGGSTITYTSASPQFSYSGTSADYTITINPSSDFAQNKVISVVINASDLHVAPNVMTPVSYSFTTVDSDAPTFSTFVPAQSAANVAADTNVSFHIVDSVGGAGVDINNTSVTVAGITYTSVSPQFSYTGTSADYAITINPSSNFSGGQTVTVSINTQDLASTPNTASTSYTFSIASTCSTCFVDSESPARFTTTATLGTTISFRVKDTGDGINPNTITVTLIGTGAAFPVSPLTITGASAAMDVTGTAANELVTITLPATTEVNIPYSVYITASNVNGLAMAPVGYTVSTISGSGTTIVYVTSSCPAVQECTASSEQANGGNNRGNGNTVRNIDPEDVPEIIAERQLPRDGTIIVENGIPTHTAAPLTPYTDVKPGDWYETAVKSFLDKGILDSTKTTFRGNDSAIRAEFAKVLAKLGKLEDNAEIPAAPTFDDVKPSDWYFPFIEMVAQQGIMKGYNECIGTHPCETMPAAIISRAEAAAMIVRYYKLSASMDAPQFDDVASDAWYASVMQTAADHCVIQGRKGSATARPADAINRAEMIVMLQRAENALTYRNDCAWGDSVQQSVSASSTAASSIQATASSAAVSSANGAAATIPSSASIASQKASSSVTASSAATSNAASLSSSSVTSAQSSDAASSVAQSSASSSVHPAASSMESPDWLFALVIALTIMAIATIGVRIFVIR